MILIVEDEQVLARTCQAALEDDGHEVCWLATGEEALDWLVGVHIDLALIDIGLPGIDGMQVLRHLSENQPDAATIMMTAQRDVQTAVEAMKLGAHDFLLKPIDLDTVSATVARSLKQRRITQTWKYERQHRTQQFGLHRMIGECPEIERAKSLVRRLNRIAVSATSTPPNILITGETGTGKDLLAKAMHYEGPRCDGPFVQVNCAALPESLMESELFGHAKGAFTSAQTSKRGLFEVAEHGTLFLDEIGSLSLVLQAKILTAIETGRIRPVGSTQDMQTNVQLIAAMNQNAEEWVSEGKFREDLYHRLRVIQIHLPPLRERVGDLALLADHFVSQHCKKFQMKSKRLSPDAKKTLRQYHWPGNVRELCHCLESAVLLSGDVIETNLLPGRNGHKRAWGNGQDGEALQIDFSAGPVSLEAVEKEIIKRALRQTGQNVSRAAELLDISRDTLRYRVEKYGLMPRRNGAT